MCQHDPCCYTRTWTASTGPAQMCWAQTIRLQVRGTNSTAPGHSSCGRKRKWLISASSFPSQWMGWEIGWASHISERGNQADAGQYSCFPITCAVSQSWAHKKWQYFHFWWSFLCRKAASPPFAVENIPESCGRAVRRNLISVGRWHQSRLGWIDGEDKMS